MADISDLERQEIGRYLEWGKKQLFRELDRYYGASLPGGQRASYRFRGKGRVWFNRLLPSLKETICNEWGYEAHKADSQLKDKESLVIAVGEALGAGRLYDRINPAVGMEYYFIDAAFVPHGLQIQSF